jgi:uncharacterized protein
VAVLCHPHPLHGGTMDNKVVQTLAPALRAHGMAGGALQLPWRRLVAGMWDEGRGEVDDALAVMNRFRAADMPLTLGGFSFGGYVAAQVARRLPAGAARRGWCSWPRR